MSRTQTEIEDDIKKTNAQIQPLVNRREALRKELHQWRLDHCEVKIGEVVLAKPPGAFGGLEEAIVRDISRLEWGKPWLEVSFRKKDGTWADRRYNAYECWKKKTDQPS